MGLTINEDINYEKVRLIDNTGSQLGILNISEALNKASEEENDLILISEKSSPVVCQIGDAKKLQFDKEKQKKKAQKEQRKNQIITKEVHFRPNIEKNDFKTKLNNINSFLNKGNNVKIVVSFKSREFLTLKEKGDNIIKDIINETNSTFVSEPSVQHMKSITATISRK